MREHATPTASTNAPGPHPGRSVAGVAASRSAGLLNLVRNLLAFGEALLHTLQAAPGVGALTSLATRFGSRDLAVIVARITRGLMLASALEERLLRNATRLDSPRPGATTSAPARKRSARERPLSPQADDAALLGRLPTAQEIAARVRSKPIGIVLEQICHDLGITCEHPLWPELQQAILGNGGSMVEVFNTMMLRTWTSHVEPRFARPVPESYPTQAVASFARSGTGPP